MSNIILSFYSVIVSTFYSVAYGKGRLLTWIRAVEHLKPFLFLHLYCLKSLCGAL